jgi:hypothetical protein
MMFGRLFPRMYTGITAGLIDGRHHKRLGAAWMLFVWIVTRQTGQGKEGIVCFGEVVTYDQIAEEMNCARGSVREWTRRLVAQKYIRLERDRRGIRIFVLNPKKFRVSNLQHSNADVSVENHYGRVLEPRHSNHSHLSENAATYENPLRNNLTKQLGNNKTTAAAKSTAVSTPSVEKLAREKAIPRTMSPAEEDARRREMLLQGEKIKSRYPSSAHAGQSQCA